MRKRILLQAICLIFSINSFAQSVGIADHEIIPHSSAALEILSTSKGLLIPRLTFDERAAINQPAEGLLIYQTNTGEGFYYFDGSVWGKITTDASVDYQTISISNDTIFLSNGGYVKLPPGSSGSDNQYLSVSGDTLRISNGNYVLLSAAKDNLGNHSATQNIRLNAYYLSADGDNEGLRISTNGNAEFSHNLLVSGTSNLNNLSTSGTVDLGLNAIQVAEIENNAVTTAKIADNAITTAKIQDGQVTAAKLNNMGASTDQFLQFNGTTWIPASISSGLNYIGTWDASTNSPTISDATGHDGDFYIVSTAGTQNLGSGNITFAIGDWVIHNSTIYQRINTSNGVTSVFGRTGVVTSQTGDYTWGQIDKTVSSIDDIANVDAASASVGNLLVGNGTNWVSTVINGDLTLNGTGNFQIRDGIIEYNDLRDATGAAGSILRWNGTAWEEALFSSLEGDASTTNEIQTLSLLGTNLSITGVATPINLSSIITDNQDLSLSGSTLSLTGDATTVDLSSLIGDNQDLSLSANTLSLTNDATPVSLAAYLDNTDNQDLSISGTTLSLTGDATPVDLSSINTDNQDLSLSANTLSLTNDATPVSLAEYLDNTDSQDLSISGNTLSLTGDATPVDLSSINTDNQQLSISGNTLGLTNSVSVTLPAATGDNLGNHIATNTLTMGEYWISGDGEKEGIRINNSGYVGIGPEFESPAYPLHIVSPDPSQLRIESNSLVPDGIIRLAMNQLVSPTSANDFIQFIDGNNNKIGQIEGDGSAVRYTVTSDARLKENITVTEYGLNTIDKIKVYNFNFKGSSEEQTGFLAQELYKVYPVAVSVGGDDPKSQPWGIDYGKLTPLLTKAVQDLNSKVDSLKADNEALKTENQNLKEEIDRLSEYEERLSILEKQFQQFMQAAKQEEE